MHYQDIPGGPDGFTPLLCLEKDWRLSQPKINRWLFSQC